MDGQMALSIQLIAGLTVALAHMVECELCLLNGWMDGWINGWMVRWLYQSN